VTTKRAKRALEWASANFLKGKGFKSEYGNCQLGEVFREVVSLRRRILKLREGSRSANS
jgi:hypothetical protein